MRNILCDFHNKDLLVSLYYLFTKRLGYTIYVPYGREWFDEGYWTIIDGGKFGKHAKYAESLCDQFLCSHNFYIQIENELGIKINKLSLQEFKDAKIKFDIILSSVPSNILPFRKLKKFQPNVKEIFQSGNNHHHLILNEYKVHNLLSAARGPYHFLDCHKVFYHSEFDLSYVRPDKNYNSKYVLNMCHMSPDPCWDDPRKIFYDLESHLIPNGWKFKFHGMDNRDGILAGGVKEISDEIKKCGFLYHYKIPDEGYGINIHYAFACGKPIITNTKYMTVVYDRSVKNTASLLFDENTIIDVNGLKLSDIIYELRKREENYEYYSNKVYSKFREVVNFDKDQIKIEKFLENLV